MTADAQAEALKTRISDYTKAPTLDLDEIKALSSLPAYYCEFYLSHRAVDNPARLNGTFEPTGFRCSTRVVAKNSIGNARQMEANIRAAFLLNPVTLDGQLVDVRYEQGGGDFEAETEDQFVTWYSALTDWIYVR